jgi:hypothetical protein
MTGHAWDGFTVVLHPQHETGLPRQGLTRATYAPALLAAFSFCFGSVQQREAITLTVSLLKTSHNALQLDP